LGAGAEGTKVRALLGRLLLGCAVAAASLAAAVPANAHHTVEGELHGVHADYFDQDTSETHWLLDTAHGTIGVLPTTLPALSQGHNEVALEDEDPGASVAGPVKAAAPVAAPVLGGHKLAVIAFNFATNAVQPWTLAQIRSSIFTGSNSTSAFYREESHDQLWFTGKDGNLDGDVFGWYTLPAPTGCSDTGSDAYNWASLAMAQASALNGFNAANYQHVMFVFPYYGAASGGCRWAGLGELPGKYSWINGGDNGVLTVRVTGHELGHNLGIHHADSWDCTGASGQRVPISDNCALTEYNDPFDVMGSFGSRHSNSWHLEQLGVLPPSNVQTVTTSGAYSMAAATDSAMPTTLRIPSRYSTTGGVKDWYYLEIRKPGGVFENFLASDPVSNGVTIRLDDDPSRLTQSRLIDLDTTNGIVDSALQPGETFSDGQISVTTLSAGLGAATVSVNLAAPPLDQQSPSAPTGLSHVFLTSGLRLSWNAAGDNVGVSSYPVFRDGIEIGSSATRSFDDTSVTPGQHVYTVYARDAANNRSAASAPHVVDVPAQNVVTRKETVAADHRAPRLRLSRKRLRGHLLLLTARAKDGSGIARLELRIDGHRVRARRAGKLSYRWHLRTGRHRFTVVAYDKKGNRATYRLSLRLRA
jgi:M6 family metalloprotease-like protein